LSAEINSGIMATMRTKPKLPRGWSWPLKSSEVSTWFEKIDYVTWHSIQKPQKHRTLGHSIVLFVGCPEDVLIVSTWE
jgi:hypothetical protein